MQQVVAHRLSFGSFFLSSTYNKFAHSFRFSGHTNHAPLESSQSRQPSTSQAAIKRDSSVQGKKEEGGEVEGEGEGKRVLLGSASQTGDSHIVSCNQGMSRAE